MYNLQTKVPVEELCERLRCSKPFVYKLIEAGLITPYYFEGNFTKAYFDLEQVEQSLKPMPDGGVKRKNYRTHEPA